jgi:steroid delta-isomerase
MSTTGGTMGEETLTARELGIRSRAAVGARDRDGWLDLFAEDALVADPIGPSPFDPEAKGHHGREAIAAFYDTVIASSEGIEFEIEQSYLCGDEVADVGIIRTTLAGGTHQAVVRGVYTYRSNGAGKLASLRAFWEFNAVELVELTPHP